MLLRTLDLSAGSHWCFGSKRIQTSRQEETETGHQTRRLHSTVSETQVLMCTHTQVQVTNISPQRDVSMAAGGNKHGVCEWCDREAERRRLQLRLHLLYCFSCDSQNATVREIDLVQFEASTSHLCRRTSMHQISAQRLFQRNTFQSSWFQFRLGSVSCSRCDREALWCLLSVLWSDWMLREINTSSLCWRIKLSLHTERVLFLILDPLICCRAGSVRFPHQI